MSGRPIWVRVPYNGAQQKSEAKNDFRFLLVKRTIANKNIVIFKVNNTELFCQVELPLSDYPLYGKQIAAS